MERTWRRSLDDMDERTSLCSIRDSDLLLEEVTVGNADRPRRKIRSRLPSATYPCGVVRLLVGIAV